MTIKDTTTGMQSQRQKLLFSYRARMRKKYFTSFAALNITQFFSAMNDNIFKLLLVFLLITIHGPAHSNTILSLAGAVFVIPFILFASLSGTLADRFSKRSIIYFTRLLEIAVLCLGVIAFAFKSAIGGYAVLFLMATQSSIFSPAKYGIVPEIVKRDRISHCNGVMTATTYLAIILGTFAASFLADITHKNFVVAALAPVVFASISAVASIGIKRTKPQAAKKKVSARFISEIFLSLKKARRTRYLLPTLIFGAYFLFIGAYTQLNIIPFAMQSLGLSEVQGGYLFLMTAIGIGIGSFLAGKLAGKEIELGFVPLAALAICFLMLFLWLFASFFYVVVPLLILLGLMGGFYVVPVDAFIQVASPPQDRGQNVAAANFLSFLGVIFASFLIAFLGNFLELTAAQGFLCVSFLTFIVALLLLLLEADQVLRLIIAKVAGFFWDLKVIGAKHMRPTSAPVLLIGQRLSWLDTVVVMASLPRLIRYIVPIQEETYRKRSFYYWLLRLIPLDLDHFLPLGPEALDEIQKELKLGHSVCLMLPVEEAAKSSKEWAQALKERIKDLPVPVVPIHIERKEPDPGLSYREQLKSLFSSPVTISYSSKLAQEK